MLFRPPHQDLIELKPDGPPIGLDDDALFQSMEIKLQAKDVLFFYTDGLLGAVPELNQTEAFKDMIIKMGLQWTASQDAEKLSSEIDHKIPENKRDDDTCLIIASIQ